MKLKRKEITDGKLLEKFKLFLSLIKVFLLYI